MATATAIPLHDTWLDVHQRPHCISVIKNHLSILFEHATGMPLMKNTFKCTLYTKLPHVTSELFSACIQGLVAHLKLHDDSDDRIRQSLCEFAARRTTLNVETQAMPSIMHTYIHLDVWWFYFHKTHQFHSLAIHTFELSFLCGWDTPAAYATICDRTRLGLRLSKKTYSTLHGADTLVAKRAGNALFALRQSATMTSLEYFEIRQHVHFLKEKTADRLYLLVKRAALLHKE